MILARLFGQKSGRQHVENVYTAIVAAARRPILYEDYQVADTLDGRFDMVILHAFLVMDRLKAGDAEAHAFSQQLADHIFLQMDHAFREMGVGDLSVAKRVRKLAEVFYGRVGAYAPAIVAGESELAEALRRNVYPEGVAPEALAGLVHYVTVQRDGLAKQQPADVARGDLSFPEVPA
jgi:cytochrome b pre-mRNA-processing protein 3